MIIPGEIVAIRIIRHIGLKIVARNAHHPLVIAKSLEEHIAESKKRQRGKTIVFKYYTLVFMFEEPGDSATDSLAAAEIVVSEQCMDFAAPIDGRGDPP